MKERPILFSAPMVRAILAGTKSQTRRALTIQPGDETRVVCEHFNQTVIDRHGDEQPGPEIFGAWWDDGESGLRCPYGAPGDRLWVRETHYCIGETREVFYRATDGWSELQPPMQWTGPWKPSIFMPRWASRILLEVTDIRVQRLQDISDADAIEEGVDRTNTSIPGYARDRYKALWESINGAGSWDANPWCWAVSFKVLPIAGPSTKSEVG